MMRLITIIAFLCFTLTGTANAGECYRFAFIGFNSRVADSNLDVGLIKNYPVFQEMLMVELSDCEKIELIDTSGIVRQFNANEKVLPLDEKKVPAYAQGFAPVHADFYLCGYITNASIKKSEQGIMYQAVFGGELKTVEVNLSVNIIDAKTLKNIFVATGKGQETTTKTLLAYDEHALRFGKEYVPDESVFRAIEKATQQVGDKIIRNI